MKKLKKILSVLSAVSVLSTCAVSAVYADEAVTEPTEATETTEPTDSTDEKISDSEKIAKLLNEFADECKIPDFRAAVASAKDEMPNDYVSVFWRGDTSHERIKNLIENFIKDKNIDETKIFGIPGEMWIEGWFCDINKDNKHDVRDCAYLASSLANGEKLNYKADYNSDGKVNVRDAATIAQELATVKF